jgi:hypothetical protein
LATAGVDASGAISREVVARADRVNSRANLYNFDYAYQLMRTCAAPTSRTPITNAGNGGTCDIISTAETLRSGEVAQRIDRLSRIIRLRSRALDQIAAAYRALGAEADYDAQADFENKIKAASDGVNALASAVGLGAIPEVVTTGARILGGVLAAHAQQRRLVRDSARLQAIAVHLRSALVAEQNLHAQVDAVTVDLDVNTRRSLAQAGLVPPLPALRDVVTVSGFPAVSDGTLQSTLDRDPGLAAAARVTALASRPASPDAALEASIAVLDALIAKHREFEAGRPLTLADLTAAVARLTELVDAAKADLGHDDTGAAQGQGGH